MNTKLRKHAFLTRRGFEYRECGAWKIEEFDIFRIVNQDQLFARLWSENRAVWVLNDDIAGDIRSLLTFTDSFAASSEKYHVVKNSVREIDEEENKIHISGEIEDAREISARISFRPKNTDDRTRDCLILFPEKSEQWEMSEEDDPEVVERALDMLQEYFGRSLVYPPGRLSTYLMEGCRDRAKEQVDYKRRPSNEALQIWVDLVKDGNDALDDWKRSRPFTKAEKKMKYLHAFDKNAMYLQAVGIPLGLGEYRYYRHTDVEFPLSNWERPGFYLVRSQPYFAAQTGRGFGLDPRGGRNVKEWFNPPGLKGSMPFSHWVTTPQFKLMCELDLICDVEGAYLADESSKLFATYYSHIKKLLDHSTLPDRPLIGAKIRSGEYAKMARRFAKCIYSRGVGYLRAEFAKRNGEWFYRPDWWATIVAEAGARLFRDVLEVRREHGALPVAVYVDCLYYASNERDPYKAFPIFGDKFKNKFKHKGTCELTKELASAHENDITPGTFGGMFKRAAKEFEEVES